MRFKLKLLLSCSLLLAVLLTINYSVKSNSLGAPTGRTGSTHDGGNSCADGGCHSDYSLNDTLIGKQTVQLLDSGTVVTSYKPGKSYVISISQTRSGTNRMGFETSVFRSSAKTSHAGSLTDGGNSAVQVYGSYATHTSPSIAKTGKGTWSVSWKAPAAGTGSVDICSATNAADGDGTTFGDYIFTSVHTITESTTGIDEAEKNIRNVSIYPNPANNFIHVNYSLEKAGNIEMEITDINGNLVQRLFYGNKPSGANSFSADLDRMAPGLYLLRMTVDDSSLYKKILVQQ